VLSEAEINAFIADGFVAIRQAVPAGVIKSLSPVEAAMATQE